MPKRVYVRGHYRTYGKRSQSAGGGTGCIGFLVFLAIIPLILIAYIIISNAAIAIPLLLLTALIIISVTIYRKSRQRRLQQAYQTYQTQQYSIQQSQMQQYHQQYVPSKTDKHPQPQLYTSIQQPPTNLAQLILMTPQQFEECAASIMRSVGLTNVQVIGKSGDHGIDIIAQSDGNKIVAQCKRYHPGKKVGNADLRNFVGAMSYVRAQKGWFITTSTFSEQAKRYASAYPGKIILLDGNDLLRCIQHYQPPITIQQY